MPCLTLRFFGDPGRIASEGVTLFRYPDFFACKLIVFSTTFCEKSIKSQPLRMTPFSMPGASPSGTELFEREEGEEGEQIALAAHG